MRYYVAIPTYNGGEIWHLTVANIKKYMDPDLYVHVIDSSSNDNTAKVAEEAGFEVISIPGNEFNHGGTRNRAVNLFIDEYDIVIFLTQDAIPEPGFLQNIINAFNDDMVVCAYGRQLPHRNANPIAQHARQFNYPKEGYISSSESIAVMGLKSVFMSNSFSAYRLSVFKEIGGFPSNTILCEDMFYTAKALLSGYKCAYVPEAMVRHSHNYKPIEEFKRYFDIGVFHSDEAWIREKFGSAGGEGRKFIISELKFLLKKGPIWIPVAILNNFMKLIGYKLGQNYKKIPKYLTKYLSMHKRYWGN
ncbi:glycosyltransferase family 2 protein [Klebsiella pasteurii]|uniref:glycosyltransferase family 2 protein n=1 Tax=Klebsiella TaxID=570 RepID=UPI0009E4606D|nr:MULTISPECIES: glycosyltransferase [Klebsiella]MDS7915276.1 glycosyltransferase [Klebsiella pasteurii]OQR48889.1 rhamnosyltransferase [Klebsiella oxytoca]